MNGVERALRRRHSDDLSDHPGRDEAGFGLIDCIIAMVVLLGILIPTSYLFTNVLGQAASARQRLTALSVAEQWVETLNNQGPPSDSNSQPEVGTAINEGTTKLSGITYSVSALFKWTDSSGGTPNFCSTSVSPVLGLGVTVSWGSNQSITDETILNFPASGNLTDGYVAVQVSGDPAGSEPIDVFNKTFSTRVQQVPVQVSGSTLSSPYSLTPDANGCVFIQLAPGTYSVQVGPTGSYVANYNESSSETQALSNQAPIIVTAAEITQVTFQYDEGTTVGLAYPDTTAIDDGLVCPAVSTVLTCMAMGQTYSSSSSPNASPVAVGIVKKSGSWSTATVPSSVVRLEDVDCTSSACIAVGYGSAAAAAAISTNGTTWTTSTLPSGVANLTNIVCPTSATTPACLVIGTNSSGAGVILTATISGSTATWTNDTVPTNTGFSQITCPSSSAQPLCFVVGTNSSGAIIISNTGSGSPGTTWTSYTQSGMTMTTVTGIACTSTTFCEAIGTGKIGAGSLGPVAINITGISGTAVTWKPYTASGVTMSTFTSLACKGSTFCWAAGTGKIGSSSVGPIVIYCNTTTGEKCSNGTTASAWLNDTVPSGLGSISGLTCPSTTVCFALDTSSSGAAGVIGVSGTTWSAKTLPSSVNIAELSQLTCPSATACYALGASTTQALIIVLKSGTWSSASFTPTTSGTPIFIDGLVCTAATTCMATGASETTAEVLDYTSSSITFSGSSTPSSLTGLYLDNPPIMVSNSNLQPNSTVEMAAPTTSNGPQTAVGPLFPFSSGYSIAAGECASELTAASVSASTTPGALPSGTTPLAPTVTLPLGLLPIQATNTSGTPISGATVTIADSCGSPLTPLSSGGNPALSNPPANPSNPTSYSMPNSGQDGLSRIDVVYGTYTVTVKLGSTSATTSVTVGPTTITVGSTTYYMPTYVPIPD